MSYQSSMPLASVEKHTLLVVDDTPDNLVLMGGLLKDEYRVKVATSGAQALQIMAMDTKPDLVLLDLMMPEMDGYEVLRRLKADRSTWDIPVIILTALNATENEQVGLDLGAVDYIAKPMNAAVLMSRVRNQLQLKVARDILANHASLLEREVKARTADLAALQDVTIRAMASLAETRDNDTGNHIRRTQNYVAMLAFHLQEHPRFSRELTSEAIELLFKSAPLHDIGKVGIPDRILLKPAALDAAEFEIMKTHTTLGYEAIVTAERDLGQPMAFLRYAKEIALSHQEWWDGSGYPQGLAGDAIPLSARLMAVADVYDALISKRVYKPAFSHEVACNIILAGSGTHFDPDVVAAFEALTDEFQAIAERYKDPES